MQEKHGYSIEEKNGRFIVYRITEHGNKLRQGSEATYALADKKIEESIKRRKHM